MIINNFQELRNIEFDIVNVHTVLTEHRDGSIDDYTSEGRHKHMFHMMLTENSARIYRYAGGEFNAYTYDVLFLPDKSKYHTSLDCESEHCQGIFIGFELLNSKGEKIEINASPNVLMRASGDIKKLLFDVHHAFTRKQENYLAIKAAMFTMLNSLQNSCALAGEKTYRQIKPALVYIENNSNAGFSILQLAQMCFLSETHFRRIFKIYTNGLTPIEYKNRIRLIKAKSLYESTNSSLEEIAENLGFCDAAYLCRLYKKKFNKTINQ